MTKTSLIIFPLYVSDVLCLLLKWDARCQLPKLAVGLQLQNINYGDFLDFKPEIKALIYNDSSSFNTALCNNILLNNSFTLPTRQQVNMRSDHSSEKVLRGGVETCNACLSFSL